MKLSQTQKDAIVLEERYRMEVRRNLNEAAKPENRILKFLNSTFGLWLLSAIFISGAGTVYQRVRGESDKRIAAFQLKLEERAANTQAIEKLDIEISYRISSALIQLYDAHLKEILGPEQDNREIILTILRNLSSSTPAGLYPEHAQYSLPTLFAELRRRLPADERPDVENSLAKLPTLGSAKIFASPTTNAEDAAADILDSVVIKRWKTTAFHFIDCPGEKPFC